MLKKTIFLLFLTPIASQAIYEVDMTMDRPYTTDMAIPTSQVYYKAINCTRCCERACPRINRWARCNRKNLRVDPCLLNTDIDTEEDCQ